MKIHVEIECSPEEARRFMGLPDVSKANEVYVDNVAEAIKGAASTDQMQAYAKQLAPMGEIGLKMFQQFVEKGAGAAMAGFAQGAAGKKADKPED